mgnify:CR=1 FL=1
MIEAMVVNRLLKWARWKLASCVALGYPREISYMREVSKIDPALKYEHLIFDDECRQTNEAFELLPQLHQLVLRLEYLSAGGNELMRAHWFGTSIRTYRTYRNDAYRLLGNILDSRLTSLPVLCSNQLQCDVSVSS